MKVNVIVTYMTKVREVESVDGETNVSLYAEFSKRDSRFIKNLTLKVTPSEDGKYIYVKRIKVLLFNLQLLFKRYDSGNLLLDKIIEDAQKKLF